MLGIDAAEASLANSRGGSEKDSLPTAPMLREHGNYGWLTEKGGIVVLNNGIEFGATYFVMLLVLLFHGPGRYVSMDYWIQRALDKGRRDV